MDRNQLKKYRTYLAKTWLVMLTGKIIININILCIDSMAKLVPDNQKSSKSS